MNSLRFRAVIVSAGLLLLLTCFLFFSREVEVQIDPVSDSSVFSAESLSVEDFAGVDSFESFSNWLAVFRGDTGDQHASLMEVGMKLALSRAGEMKALIQTDPERALARAFSLAEREGMPGEMLPLIEQPFSTRAELDVIPLCTDSDGHSRDEAFGVRDFTPGSRRQGFEIDLKTSRGERMKGFVYGKRLDALSRTAAPVQGVSLDGLAALREEVFTRVPETDLEEIRRRYTLGPMGSGLDFLTAEPVGDQRVAAIAGGQLHFFASVGNLNRTNDLASKVDGNIGEENGAQLLFTQRLSVSHAPLDPDAVVAASEELAAIPADFNNQAVVIMVDFSDKVGRPIDESTLQTRMDGEVHDQLASMSYHKIGITTTILPIVFRMPNPTTYYNGTDDGSKKNSELFNDAIAAATAAGYTTSSYRHRCVFFKGIGMGYCGLASVGGTKIWLPCHSSKVIVHELGHNLGLHHAAYWTPTNSDPVDPEGTSSEYGDNTSIMGGGGVPTGHFHVQAKRKLGWLESDQQVNVGTGVSEQTIRLYRADHEDTSTTNRERAIRVVKGTNEYFWIGYRQRFGSAYANYQKGLQVHWQQGTKLKSWLIDLTEGGGKNNSGLPVGRTYSDPASNVHITALRRGGAAPNQWIDTKVNVGPFGGNSPPVGLLNLPDRYPVDTNVILGSSVSDSNSDELTYFFDVGDGSVLGDDGTQSWRDHSWSSTGMKSVEMVVSDGKGGVLKRTGQVEVQASIPVPTGVSATDGAHTDRIVVSWPASPSATSYRVYRSDENQAGSWLPVATVSDGTEWEDTSVVSTKIYYYRVQALGANSSSALSEADAGTTPEGPPPPPTNLSVSDNRHTDRIQLSWAIVAGAASYEILRSEAEEIAEATLIATVSGRTNFSDTTAAAGVRFYYWVRSTNAFGGAASEKAFGSRKLLAPLSLEASDGQATDVVQLSWEPVPNAMSYRIFRGNAAESTVVQIGESAEASYDDSPSSVMTEYWYAVRAYSDGSGEGEQSLLDSGFRIFESPGSFATVQREFDDRIGLSWNAVSVGGSTQLQYVVYRAPAGSAFGSAVEIARTSDTGYEDFSAVPGVEYSYWIVGQLEDGGVVSPPGDPISGIRAEAPPFQPDLAIGVSPSAGMGNNITNASAAGQSISQVSKKGKPLTWYIRLENDGLFKDHIRVIGSGGDRFFETSLVELFGARRNVTGSSVAGGYRVSEMAPDSTRLFAFTVKPTKKARKRGKQASFDIRSVSSGDVGHMDRVLMVAIAKKDKKRRRRR